MKQLEFTTLKLFVAVAETGSLSAVAQSSNIAVAAISKRISDLEASVGSRFFERHARGMSLTPAGHALLQHAREIIYGVDRLQADLRAHAHGVKGHVRVAAMGSAASEFLPEELKRFTDLHPNVAIALSEMTSSQVVAAVQDGRVDIGIFLDPGHGTGITCFPYRRDRLCLVVPVAHRFAGRDSLRFIETLEEDYIGLAPSSSIARRMMAESGGRLRLRISVLGALALCRMVAAGLGIGIAPYFAARYLTMSTPVRLIRLEDDWAERQMLIGIRAGQESLSGAARSFLAHCQMAAEPQ